MVALLAALLCAAPASAQDEPPSEDRSVLILLDGSDSMNEPAGEGRDPAGRRQGARSPT